MPTPGEDESQEEFIARCIPIVIEDQELDAGDEEERNQAVAICHSTWRQAQEEQGKAGGKKMKMERKIFSTLATKADGDQGVVETVFAVFGNVDEGGDVIHPGAFSKTFAERGNKVKVLDAHNAGSVRDVIGKPLELREMGRDELPQKILETYPMATGGALARIQFLMDTPEGEGAFKRIKSGAVDEWSFGYDALDFDNSQMVHDGEDTIVRNLRTLRLYEISPVLWGMNPATMTTGAKSTDELGDDDTLQEKEGEGGEAEKAGRVLAQRNADRITGALMTIIEVLEDAGLDVPGWSRQPQAQRPEDDEGKTSDWAAMTQWPSMIILPPGNPGQKIDSGGKEKLFEYHYHITVNSAPIGERAANEDELAQAGPTNESPTSLEQERLNLLLELESL